MNSPINNTTVPNDSQIVLTVDDDARDHATIVYKLFKGNGISQHKGWRSTSYKCNYCSAKKASLDAFARHLRVCKGLID